ncbi:aminopeptidase [Rhizina undulata]
MKPSNVTTAVAGAAPGDLEDPTDENKAWDSFKAWYVTPGCSALEYAVRRAKLASELPEGGVAILPSSDINYRSGPVIYEVPSRPGLSLPHQILRARVRLQKTGKQGEHNFYLFVRGKDSKAELWDGARSGVQAAVDVQRSHEQKRHCVSLCRENAKLSLDDIHITTEQGLERELKDLGFDLRGRALNEMLFPHHVGHFVGLDVHDPGSYSRGLPLRAGQCITVELGIYVPDDERWPKHFRKMGIRIEDSICVGEEGPIVLSVEAVKEVVDIEALGEKHWRLELW